VLEGEEEEEETEEQGQEEEVEVEEEEEEWARGFGGGGGGGGPTGIVENSRVDTSRLRRTMEDRIKDDGINRAIDVMHRRRPAI